MRLNVVTPSIRNTTVIPIEYSNEVKLSGVLSKQHHLKPSITPTIGLSIKTDCKAGGNLFVSACVPKPTGEM